VSGRQALCWTAVVAILGAGITATIAAATAMQDDPRAPGAVWAHIPGPRAPR
jgi:hypothetical protein